jgi:predicted SAM-dependent methyltransferase
MKKLVLNLGCGRNYRYSNESTEYINCDNSTAVKTDKCFDLRKEFPFEPETADEVLLLNLLPCIQSNEDVRFVMNSCWDVLKNGCSLIIDCASAKHIKAFKDPFASRYWVEESWAYFDHNTIQYKNFGSVYGFKPWNEVIVTTDADSIMHITMRK